MDILTVKEEWDDGDITIEYNDITKDPIVNKQIETNNGIKKSLTKNVNSGNNVKIKAGESPTKTLVTESVHNIPADDLKVVSKVAPKNTMETKIKVTINRTNENSIRNSSTKVLKSPLTDNTNTELPNSSYTRTVRPIPFNGARFLHAQVHSNGILQSLLKDIITLNNEKDDIDENAINQEIASLRSKNNLPSFNPEVSVELDDSDFGEDSEDDSITYYGSKGSENYGKDSGYDNESQYSESFDDDKSEIQDSNSNEKSLVLVEPEYIDLDNYYGNRKRKLDAVKSLLVKSKSSQYVKKTPAINLIRSNVQANLIKTNYINRPSNNNVKLPVKSLPEAKKFFDCLGKCKFYGTKLELLKHKQEKHLIFPKTITEVNTELPITCGKCYRIFFTHSSLDQHYKYEHKKKTASSKRAKPESGSDSDSIEIVEIEEGD